MSKVSMTVRQIKDLGLWDKVCDYKNINPYAINEGLINYDDIIEFDTEFKKEKKIICEVCGKEISSDETVAVFTENCSEYYTHTDNDGYDCDYRYMLERLSPEFIQRSELEGAN